MYNGEVTKELLLHYISEFLQFYIFNNYYFSFISLDYCLISQIIALKSSESCHLKALTGFVCNKSLEC